MTNDDGSEVQRQIVGYAKLPGNSVTDKTTPMSKLKDPVSLDDYHALNGRFDFWAVQLTGDNAAYHASHMPQYMHQHRSRSQATDSWLLNVDARSARRPAVDTRRHAIADLGNGRLGVITVRRRLWLSPRGIRAFRVN